MVGLILKIPYYLWYCLFSIMVGTSDRPWFPEWDTYSWTLLALAKSELIGILLQGAKLLYLEIVTKQFFDRYWCFLTIRCLSIMYRMGQVTKLQLSCYLVLLSIDSKTRYQDSHSFVIWPIYIIKQLPHTRVIQQIDQICIFLKTDITTGEIIGWWPNFPGFYCTCTDFSTLC